MRIRGRQPPAGRMIARWRLARPVIESEEKQGTVSQDNRKKYAETPDGNAVAGGIDAPENPVASLDGSKEAPAADAGAAFRCAQTGEIGPVATPAGKAGGQQEGFGEQGADSCGAVQDAGCPSESDEPFEGDAEDIADLAEVIARDERSATLPPKGTSSVATALGQRPPRLAKPKRGPRTNMLEQLIPEVIIPTDALKTMGFTKVRVVESSELEQLKKAAQADSVQGEQGGSVGEGAAGDASDTEGVSGEGKQAKPETSEDATGDQDGRTRDGGVVVRDGKNPPSERPYARIKDAKSPRRKKRIFTPFRIAVCAVLLVVLFVVAAGGAFAWDRWYRFDDFQDIQGEWKMTNAERTVVITEDKIKIADNVSYGYTLDTHDKTITYSFGEDSMTAAYRFSPDRQYLIIDESGKTDWLVAMHLKEDKVLADRDVPQGVSKLSKLSNDTEADPKDTEEIREDEDMWSGGTWVYGYFDYKRPKIETAEEKEEAEKKEAEKKKKKQQQNGSSEDGSDDSENDEDASDDEADGETDEYDDGAAYVDEETGARYYYDPSQMLYYDLAGNYYYDMYGNNPYYPPAADDGIYY